MKPWYHAAALLGLLLAGSAAHAQGSPRERLLMDFGWKFHLGNSADPDKDFGYGTGTIYAKAGEGVGPIEPSFSDAGWRTLDLPHDWSIELPFVPNDGDLISHGSKPIGGKFPATSIGWYRKTFSVAKDDQGKKLSIEFDGVFRDCRVWLNGHFLGHHDSGYSGFAFDIGDVVNFDGPNTLTVRVDATQNEGWFYEGTGIYRHVWLTKTSPVHITRHGLYAIPKVVGANGDLTVQVDIANETAASKYLVLDSELMNQQGAYQKSARSIPTPFGPYETKTVVLHFPAIAKPHLWSTDDPFLYSLYTLVSEVTPTTKSTVDVQQINIGFRTLRWDKDKGFFLNGKPFKIQGTCNHQDHAGLGSALPDAIQYFRIKKLKEMGSNAYRTSHNDPTPELLDACDRLGMVVMDEHRLMESSRDSMEQLRELVTRDRNHPSVFMWSIGNEEPIMSTSVGKRTALAMMREIHKLDTTRPISAAANNGNNFEGSNEVLNLRGWNYLHIGDMDKYHRDHPNQPMFGSEDASTLSTRGIYANDPKLGYMSAYDENRPGWGAFAEEWWTYAMARPFYAGGFAWTGFDYRGEPTPYGWPCISSHFGIMDTCGFPKDNYYYYKSWWTKEPTLHLLPHWTWPGKEGKPIDVWAQTNCSDVELFVNGKSQGRVHVKDLGHAEWKGVIYQPGSIEAKGYVHGKLVKDEVVNTAGPVKSLTVTPDRTTVLADGEDAVVFTIAAKDANGNLVPNADDMVEFSLAGDAQILGVGNGDPSCHEPDTYFSEPKVASIDGWTMQEVPFDEQPPTAYTGSPSTAAVVKVGVKGEARQIRNPQSAAIFSAKFNLSAQDLASGFDTLSIGNVDDLGWVYLNGQLIGTTDDWSRAYTFRVQKTLKEGQNELVVWVRNTAGRGGLGHEVTLTGVGETPTFKRSLFNGLAQVIVKVGRAPGAVALSAVMKGVVSATTAVEAKLAKPRPYVP